MCLNDIPGDTHIRITVLTMLKSISLWIFFVLNILLCKVSKCASFPANCSCIACTQDINISDSFTLEGTLSANMTWNETELKNQCSNENAFAVLVTCSQPFWRDKSIEINITASKGTGNNTTDNCEVDISSNVTQGRSKLTSVELWYHGNHAVLFFINNDNPTTVDTPTNTDNNTTAICESDETLLCFLTGIINHPHSWVIWVAIGGIVLLCFLSNVIVYKCTKRGKSMRINHRMSVFGNCDLVNQSGNHRNIPQFEYDTADQLDYEARAGVKIRADTTNGAKFAIKGNPRDTCYEKIDDIRREKIVSYDENSLQVKLADDYSSVRLNKKSGDYDLPWGRKINVIPECDEINIYSLAKSTENSEGSTSKGDISNDLFESNDCTTARIILGNIVDSNAMGESPSTDTGPDKLDQTINKEASVGGILSEVAGEPGNVAIQSEMLHNSKLQGNIGPAEYSNVNGTMNYTENASKPEQTINAEINEYSNTINNTEYTDTAVAMLVAPSDETRPDNRIENAGNENGGKGHGGDLVKYKDTGVQVEVSTDTEEYGPSETLTKL